jgi:hypothetical protein
MSHHIRGDDGFALFVAMMGLLMLSAVGAALVLGTSNEALIARNFRDATAAVYAAETLVGRALVDLSAEPDWSAVVGGPAQSSFFDGVPGALRTLADGSAIDLTAVLNLWNCGKRTPCSAADMDAVSNDRPWGLNNPRWRLYACGPVAAMAAPGSRHYGIVLAADDPAETDNNPALDGGGADNPGRGVLLLRGEAFGPGGSHAAVDVTVSRGGETAVRVLSWRLSR